MSVRTGCGLTMVKLDEWQQWMSGKGIRKGRAGFRSHALSQTGYEGVVNFTL